MGQYIQHPLSTRSASRAGSFFRSILSQDGTRERRTSRPLRRLQQVSDKAKVFAARQPKMLALWVPPGLAFSFNPGAGSLRQTLPNPNQGKHFRNSPAKPCVPACYRSRVPGQIHPRTGRQTDEANNCRIRSLHPKPCRWIAYRGGSAQNPLKSGPGAKDSTRSTAATTIAQTYSGDNYFKRRL
jgi:hypothetical protein